MAPIIDIQFANLKMLTELNKKELLTNEDQEFVVSTIEKYRNDEAIQYIGINILFSIDDLEFFLLTRAITVVLSLMHPEMCYDVIVIACEYINMLIQTNYNVGTRSQEMQNVLSKYQ